MTKKSKITFDALMARAEQRKAAKPTVKMYYSEILEGELELIKLPLTEYLDMLDGADDTESLQENLEFSKKLIFKHCKLMQSKELQEAYGCAEPYDIVLKVFEDNMGEIGKCASAVNSLYGIEEDNIKN